MFAGLRRLSCCGRRCSIAAVGSYCHRSVTTCDGRAHGPSSTCLHACGDTDQGLGIARVDIAVVSEHVTTRVATDTRIGQPARFGSRGCIGHAGRRVVGAANGYRDLRGTGQTTSVGQRVSKDIAERLSAGAQGLNSGVGVVDCICVATIGGYRDRAVVASDTTGHRSRSGSLNTDGYSLIVLVSPLAAASTSVSLLSTFPVARLPAVALFQSTGFVSDGGIGHCGRCIVAALNRDGDLRCTSQARSIGHGIGEDIC